MDWLEEKIEGLSKYIRNLSFRKAMIAYILTLAAVVFLISYLTMVLCWQMEAQEWAKYEECDLLEMIYWKESFFGVDYRFEKRTNITDKLRLLQFVRMWCPYFYAFAGMIVTICIFYRKRLALPLKILENSVERIRGNDLDFHVHYDSEDELGSLCDSVEDMRLELVRGKEEMWRLVERQKELNAAFAHDLRTPLTVLRGYTDFLARYIPEGKISEEKMGDTLALMSSHLKRLEDYSRTMKGIRSIDEVPFSPEWVGIRSIERKIGEVVFALNQVGDVKISYEGGFGGNDNGLRIKADDNIIMEVLENLLSNGIRYARREIEVLSDYDGERMEFLLTVRDDGRGFLDEQLEKALEPYHKEYESAETDEHFGIGLHICREFCKKHGGTINVANSIKGGAVVTASFFASIFGENSIDP
ncbi:HAMP domain-containing sensor histidine kinase [Sporofaciens musculi]|jgi:signal transduction histidine kinase|uniref:HAMP domain-containing sensor histidine kinase n=1 Tax=Sporofaciens musculi TaxID=2681861 RepID=UPI002570AA57|nr:HAMP domain-containing sensor histidine kinase [Sporofaciens musculi]